MLTIAYVLFALQLLSAGSPVEREEQGIRIGLTKRSALVNDGIADLVSLQQQLAFANSKYEQGFEAYKRNTGEDHPLASGLVFLNVTKRATGTVPLTDENYGELWQGTISVGTPAQTYTVDFDTGSSDLFLPGSSCTTSCQGHKTYNAKSSTSSADRRKTFTLRYGDGSSVNGEQHSDTVSIAGLTATGQALGAASTYSSGFASSRFPPDGLMGMGYQSISQYNSPPVFQTLVAQKKATQPVFAFKLATTGSELYLGGVDSSLYTGSFTYAPVTQKGYWQVSMDSVTANTKASVGRVAAIIDTGTTLIIGDSSNVRKFYQSIPGFKDASSTVGQGFYTVPCNAIPTVRLTFAGKAFTIDPSLFNLGYLSASSNDCVGGIVASSISFWIVGDVFLQNVYTSFDLGNNRVGFATLK